MSVKTLQANEYRFCTILDVVLKLPKIVTEEINLDESDSPIVHYGYQIDEAIRDASQEIYTALLPLYSIGNLEATAPWVGAIISDGQNNDPIARLLACAAGISAICEHFTLTFSTATAYAAAGYLSGSLGSGTVSANFTGSGDGDLIIAAADNTGMFSGTFAATDKIYISINKWNRFISRIAADKSIAQVTREIAYSNGISLDPAIFERYSNRAIRRLRRLQLPDDKEGYELSTLPARDLNEINLGDWLQDRFDQFGQEDQDFVGEDDIEEYTD